MGVQCFSSRIGSLHNNNVLQSLLVESIYIKESTENLLASIDVRRNLSLGEKNIHINSFPLLFILPWFFANIYVSNDTLNSSLRFCSQTIFDAIKEIVFIFQTRLFPRPLSVWEPATETQRWPWAPTLALALARVLWATPAAWSPWPLSGALATPPPRAPAWVLWPAAAPEAWCHWPPSGAPATTPPWSHTHLPRSSSVQMKRRNFLFCQEILPDPSILIR